jgi:tRNA uridine 5-carboxymethylaminomethyl modification enzyme
MNPNLTSYDAIIVGGGHAGIEATLAVARMGCTALLISMDHDKTGAMSCNPAIGGLAKGQLVKEIDALGGEMGRAIDATGIQFRILNRRRGPAVWSSRAQADRHLYADYMQKVIHQTTNASIFEAMVTSLQSENGNVIGVEAQDKNGKNILIQAKTVVLTPGTFLNGKIFIGSECVHGGRKGEKAAYGLTEALTGLGIRMTRLKTGTTPRLEKSSINFGVLEEQPGDDCPQPFSLDSDFSNGLPQEQRVCHITYTNEKTHKVVADNLKLSALYRGDIEGTGPRYCPSIEDKIVRFPDRLRHQVFIEPEGLTTDQIYPNGISTSLPADIQEKFLRTMVGLENVVVRVPGYAVEYDFADPTQLYPWLESKKLKGLFLAGQINGTSGYEEAGGQGLIAGMNAALIAMQRPPLVLKRSDGYLGVLIDDLVTKGTKEPYRMFTSRAEYRLLLREDNADQRLTPLGIAAGLVPEIRQKRFKEKLNILAEGRNKLKKTFLNPNESARQQFEAWNLPIFPNKTSLWNLLRREGLTISRLQECLDSVDRFGFNKKIERQLEIEAYYEGYIEKQAQEIARFEELENLNLPQTMIYQEIPGLSKEAIEKLSDFKPVSLGQASRISGITPAALTAIIVHVKKQQRRQQSLNN